MCNQARTAGSLPQRRSGRASRLSSGGSKCTPRVREIADQFPDIRISVLVENEEQVRQWQHCQVGVFLDINPGMNRTGIEHSQVDIGVRLVGAIADAGLEFRGLHYYDGQYGGLEARGRTAAARAGYERLLELVKDIRHSGMRVPEVITAGTPTFPCSLAYESFHEGAFIHRVSPGTLVYCDATSLAQLPGEYGYAPGGAVDTRGQPATCGHTHMRRSAQGSVSGCRRAHVRCRWTSGTRSA
jgi:Alanine racemase, N-terminal domain